MMSTNAARGKTNRRRGAMVVLLGVLLVVLFAFAAFTVDIGHMAIAAAELQNVADAAAISAAAHLVDGPSQARSSAISVAAQNKVTNQTAIIAANHIELGNWDNDTAIFTVLTGAQELHANAARVTANRTSAEGNALSLFFAPILGRNTADLTVSATAHVEINRCGLFIGRDKVTISGGSYTDSYNSLSGSYNPASPGNKGHVCSNGNIALSGSSYVDGNAFPGQSNSVSTSGSSYVTGSTTPRTEPLNLPPVDFGNAATSNNNSSIPESDDKADPYNSGNGEFSLSGGDHVSLPPGTYYFSKFTLSGGSSITVTGPTVIYCTGDFVASGSSIANTSHNPGNLEVYCTGSRVDISGGSDFYGTVYAPTSKITRSSLSGHVYGSLVGKELTLSGGGGAHADTATGVLHGTSGALTLVE